MQENYMKRWIKKNCKVAILGLTFKENCPDTRNSKVEDIIKRLKEYDINPLIVDTWASDRDAEKEYGVKLTKLEDVNEVDCVILAVAHDEFKKISLDQLKELYVSCPDNEKILIDVKGIHSVKELEQSGMRFWRL